MALPEQKAITVALPVIALIMVLRKTDARNVIMRSEISKKTVVQALIVGVIMGFYNSLFGPGIGTVAIIAFTMIMHYDARCASGNGNKPFNGIFYRDHCTGNSGKLFGHSKRL